MRALSLLDNLTRLGFRLEAKDNVLRVAPAHRLTEDLRQAIKENQGEMLGLVRHGVQTARPLSAPEIIQVTEHADSPKPVLCSRCRPFGYALCQECVLANNPGVERGADGVLYQTSYLGTPWQKGPASHPR